MDALTAEGRRSLYGRFPHSSEERQLCVGRNEGPTRPDVAGKARAAAEWCKAASTSKVKWEYLYVPEDIFKAFAGDSVAELLRTCRPTLKKILEEATSPQLALPLGQADSEESSRIVYEFISEASLGSLPLRARKGIQRLTLLFDYMAKKQKVSFSPVFQPLLGPMDAAAEGLLFARLEPSLPEEVDEQAAFFNPDLSAEKKKHQKYLENQVSLLRRFLIHRSPITPIGVLRFCLDYAAKDEEAPGGVLVAVRERFSDLANTGLGGLLGSLTTSAIHSSLTSKTSSVIERRQTRRYDTGSRRLTGSTRSPPANPPATRPKGSASDAVASTRWCIRCATRTPRMARLET